jgi:hypothetical protein
MLIPNRAAPTPTGVNLPALVGGNARNLAGPLKVAQFGVATASTPIRGMDPVTISGGVISRGTASSAALLGFAMMGTVRPEIPQIPTLPNDTEVVSGTTYNSIGVIVAGNSNEFIGQVKYGYTLLQSNRLQTCDLKPVVVAPTPTLTTAGTAGATTRYYTTVPVTLLGEAIGPNGTALTTSNATNDTTNYNIITIPYVAGAAWFNIYRGTSNSNGTLIGQVSQTATATGQTTVFNDTGLASLGSTLTVSTRDDCGWIVDPSSTSTNVVTIRELVSPAGTVSGPNTACLVTFVITPADSQWV